ncbi:MAG TPA: sigma factor-like helix-turn-helix DNA-binding protein [Spirochaetia bacterium]|nr:sigma factor-like helix-turn-helix DNA-binding protein [Spirochaetia bacterium]
MEEFEELYNSRCKFMRRYIDCLLGSRGKGNFVWALFCRACRFYDKPFVFSLVDVENHINSKFSYYEMQVMRAEKERRQETARGWLAKNNTAKMAKLPTIMDAVILRMSGSTYRRIAEELGMSEDTVKRLLLTAKGYGYRAEIKYLLRVLKEIERV